MRDCSSPSVLQAASTFSLSAGPFHPDPLAIDRSNLLLCSPCHSSPSPLVMASLFKKMFGGGATPAKASQPKSDDDQTPPSSLPNSPQRAAAGATLLFAPPRPVAEHAAAEWVLPAGALGGGSEVCRALVSLYMMAPGASMELKFESTLLLLVKLQPFTYEFKVCGKDKVLIAQPLLPALTFYFKPVSAQTRHDRFS